MPSFVNFVCFECILVRVQPGRDVVFDVLENQFLKATYMRKGSGWVESHRVAVISHQKLFSNMNFYSQKTKQLWRKSAPLCHFIQKMH